MVTRDYFQGKRIAVIGLGPRGEMISDVKFLIKANALVSLYDVRSEARLKNNIVFLRSIGLANYVCGTIPPDDLLDMDLIILSHEYTRDATFLKKATEKGIQIEYPETLFLKLSPPVTLVGVMGSCGKSTVVSVLAPLLEVACEADGNQNLFVFDPDSEEGIIAALKKIHSGDIVLMRIVESMMKEFYRMRVSPHVAVFTTVPPAGSFDTSPFEILSYQTYNNFIIASDDIIDSIHAHRFQAKAKMLRTKPNIIPAGWIITSRPQGPWSHDRENISLALQVAELFKVPHEISQDILEKWKPLKGRIEFVKKVKHVDYYNDTGSVSPEATLVALKSLSQSKNIILILGGSDAGKDYSELYKSLGQYARTIVLLPGSGTIKERKALCLIGDIEMCSAPSIPEAVELAYGHAKEGDIVLFSPGFGALGSDASRGVRGEAFVRAVRAL